jgi:putative FmdB family regulatory protein
MPIYEYRCGDCEGRFEVLTSYANREKAQVCPSCESTRTSVLVSSFAAFTGAEGEPVSVAGGGGCGPGCCGGACHSAN